MNAVARRAGSAGFTLIELMVTIAIGVILALMALPMYSTWIASQQVRTAAESVFEGIRVAQTEAVRRNTQVAFVIDTAKGWQVQLASDSSVIREGLLIEGSPKVELKVTPVGATTIMFDGLGRALKDDGSAPLDARFTVDVDSTTGFSGVRAQRVVVDTAAATGVAIRTCDPNLSVGDPRACPA